MTRHSRTKHSSAVLVSIFSLLSSVVAQASESSVFLLSQVIRKLGPHRLAPGLRLLTRVGTVPLRALGLYHLGRTRESRDLLEQAIHLRPVSPRFRYSAAEVAIATGHTDLAHILMGEGKVSVISARGERIISRLASAEGNVSGAVNALAKRNRQLREKRESDKQILEDWNPRLCPVDEFVPREKTILFLQTNSIPFTHSGYTRRSHAISMALVRRGWEVHVATRLGYPSDIGNVTSRYSETIDGVHYHRLLLPRLGGTTSERLQNEAELLKRLAQRVRPKLLHTTTHFVNALVVREVARSLSIPWVYEVRGFLADTWAYGKPETATRSERYRGFQRREAEVSKSADYVFTLGQAMRTELLEWGVLSEQLEVIPNSAGEQFNVPPLAPWEARSRLGLPKKGFFFGTVSSLVPYEGIDLLIQAFATLEGSHPLARLLIVGDGSAKPELEALVTELGIGKKVIFTGRVPSHLAPSYHQSLDVFVVPRKRARLTELVTPLKPVEAAALGRPIITSNLPALLEVAGNSRLIFKAGDYEELGSVMVEAMKRPTQGKESKVTTWDDISAKLQNIYQEIAP